MYSECLVLSAEEMKQRENFLLEDAILKQSKLQGSYECCLILPASISISAPKMGDLFRIVIPRISAHWEEVAYALYYDINIVDNIETNCSGNTKKCCQNLLKDWLKTDHGKQAGPKTWSTLLDALKRVDDLTASRDNIIQDLSNS